METVRENEWGEDLEWGKGRGEQWQETKRLLREKPNEAELWRVRIILIAERKRPWNRRIWSSFLGSELQNQQIDYQEQMEADDDDDADRSDSDWRKSTNNLWYYRIVLLSIVFICMNRPYGNMGWALTLGLRLFILDFRPHNNQFFILK